jgi:hypothetical protein
MMNAAQFVAVANAVQQHWPDAKLVKNSIGNLLVFVDDEDVGYVDLFDGSASGWDGWDWDGR